MSWVSQLIKIWYLQVNGNWCSDCWSHCIDCVCLCLVAHLTCTIFRWLPEPCTMIRAMLALPHPIPSRINTAFLTQLASNLLLFGSHLISGFDLLTFIVLCDATVTLGILCTCMQKFLNWLFLNCEIWLGNDWVDIFYQIANPSIWMYYLPDPSTNRVSFVYM